MKYLRLNNNHEYFKDGLPARFLGNIGDLNIIIGANNTRKSRFLRTIINQEHNVLFEAPENFNLLYNESLCLFDELSKKGKETLDEKILQFQFVPGGEGQPIYDSIKEYFGANSQIDFFQFKTTLNNLNESLVAVAIPSGFDSLKTIANRAYHAVNLFIWVYDLLKKDVPNSRHFEKTNVLNVHWKHNLRDNEAFPDFALKFSILKKLQKYLKIICDLKFEDFNKTLIYIPVLRTSRMIVGFKDDVYAQTILTQHFSGPTSKLKIETGMELYKKIGMARNTSRKRANSFREFEKFIGKTFYQNEDIHIVAEQTEKGEERNIKVTLPGENEDVAMHNLGDGVQAVINLLFPIFDAEDGAWVFIDEPENHLHPGYQNILIDALANNNFLKEKELRYFINTHSNHILSAALMTASAGEIMVFSRRDKDSSSIQSFNGLAYHTLELLGVFNTSVLTSNCSIWVEGVTDRFYLQAFLHAYVQTLAADKIRPIEGLHFSFVEYGGINLLHYEFDHEFHTTEKIGIENKIEAYFINSNVFLLADNDLKNNKHLPFENITRGNFIYCQTEVPEIENVLPDSIIKGYLEDVFGYEDSILKKCFPIKAGIKLGRHFKDKLPYGKGFRKIEGDGGTLKPFYKKGLADYVHKKIIANKFEWKDLEASSFLVKRIPELYEFISSKNHVVS
ncbi:AAA family ATPase [Mucilaginibacter sp. AW1-7]|uniref:AAA family ATPase n=1 Tax=Mucilaginibacter sp. AW1-7 TaxID=3349874 RepID=UPI003F7410C0